MTKAPRPARYQTLVGERICAGCITDIIGLRSGCHGALRSKQPGYEAVLTGLGAGPRSYGVGTAPPLGSDEVKYEAPVFKAEITRRSAGRLSAKVRRAIETFRPLGKTTLL